ncbi:hypothetical protein D5R40_31650 [Okeania hirsuta]|uniref:Peptidase M61 N-terminal domain-containing protein n=1 Tax=Okeania hirsuta TaxID=1458930 RepID=A0A3N6NTS4_9CYAN|nr:hypothetical protein D5R40_31650 [Okeania hirsuta]
MGMEPIQVFDNRKLHMNMPATFVYGVIWSGDLSNFCIDLSKHASWQVATQLEKVETDCYRAPNYYLLPSIARLWWGTLISVGLRVSSNGRLYD